MGFVSLYLWPKPVLNTPSSAVCYCQPWTGRTGVFLGPQDLYFAIQGANSNTVSVYRTPGFKGKGLPLYTIHLAKPTGLGAGLFPGPGALAAPRIGAEAAAKAAKEAADAADKAAQDAADAAAAAAAAGDGADGAPAAADAADGSTVAATAATAEAASEPVVSSITGRRIRLPGETWRPTDEDDDKNAGDMMVPVIGIGAAYQQAGQGGRGPHRYALVSNPCSAACHECLAHRLIHLLVLIWQPVTVGMLCHCCAQEAVTA